MLFPQEMQPWPRTSGISWNTYVSWAPSWLNIHVEAAYLSTVERGIKVKCVKVPHERGNHPLCVVLDFPGDHPQCAQVLIVTFSI